MQDAAFAAGLSMYITTADEFGDDMTQTNEDCLYLNVYTPNPSKEAKLPVSVKKVE